MLKNLKIFIDFIYELILDENLIIALLRRANQIKPIGSSSGII